MDDSLDKITGITVMQVELCRKNFDIKGIAIAILGDGEVVTTYNPIELYDRLGELDWRILTLVDERWHLSSGWERTL